MAYSDVATWLAGQWNDDWKLFFADVCANTGLSLQDAMLFHSVLSQVQTKAATIYLVEKVAGVSMEPPKEPWQL